MSPEIVPDPTQGGKPCWVCGTIIPYQKGWCESCWDALGEDRQKLVLYAHAVPDPALQGDIFAAVSHSLKREHKPPPTPLKPKPGKIKINLDDLEVPFR